MFNDELIPSDHTYAIMNQKYRNFSHPSHSISICDNDAMSPIRSEQEMSSHSGYIPPQNSFNVPESRFNSNQNAPSNNDTGRRPSPAMTPSANTPNGPTISQPRRGNNRQRKYPWQGSIASILNRIFKMKHL